MKKHPISILLLVMYLSCIFLSCEKENSKKTIQTPFDMYRKYLLVNVYTNPQIDLNFDGIENVDLTKEIDAFRNCFIYFTDKELTFVWIEPQIDQVPFLTQELPSVYTGQDIRYLAVPRHYTYSVTYWNNKLTMPARIYPVEIKEEEPQNYYTFTAPIWIEVNEENTILFINAYQYFLTEEGRKGRELTAVFKSDPADGYFQ